MARRAAEADLVKAPPGEGDGEVIAGDRGLCSTDGEIDGDKSVAAEGAGGHAAREEGDTAAATVVEEDDVVAAAAAADEAVSFSALDESRPDDG